MMCVVILNYLHVVLYVYVPSLSLWLNSRMAMLGHHNYCWIKYVSKRSLFFFLLLEMSSKINTINVMQNKSELRLKELNKYISIRGERNQYGLNHTNIDMDIRRDMNNDAVTPYYQFENNIVLFCLFIVSCQSRTLIDTHSILGHA
jgi:hypothetical protein